MAASKAARLSALLLALAIGIIGAACSSHNTVELTSWTDQLPELSEFDKLTVLSQENVLSETELSSHLPQLDSATLPGAYGGHHKRWYHHPHHHGAPAPSPAHHWHHHKAPAPKPAHHHKAPAPKPAHHHHNGPAPAPHHHGHHHHPYPHAHPPHPPHPKPHHPKPHHPHPHPYPHHKTVTGKGLENGAKVADPTTWYGRGR